MKSALFVAALMLGGTAIAQTQPSGQTVSDPSQATGPRGITQQGTDPEGMHCTPPGFNAGASGYPECVNGRHPNIGRNPESPPPCTRQVTDHCVQAYERGVRNPG